MHATEREQVIVTILRDKQGFVSFRELETRMDASPATLRRDLRHLVAQGVVTRVRGGARLVESTDGKDASAANLLGVPFRENLNRMELEKAAIGRAAAQLCEPNTCIMIDGGSTTLQMRVHLSGLNLQVFTNSLHMVIALLPLPDVRILIPGGSVFREQGLILSATGDDTMPRFHASQLFMGVAALGPQGLMQADVFLVAAERRLMKQAEQLVVLVDHTKFRGPSGNVVCGLDEVDVVVTDSGVDDKDVAMLERAGCKVVVASSPPPAT